MLYEGFNQINTALVNIISQSINQSINLTSPELYCIERNITVDHLEMQNVKTKYNKKNVNVSYVFVNGQWLSCLVRNDYVSSICGHWDHCVIWKCSVGSVRGQVVSAMCVCVCVCLATGCESVTVPSVIQAFPLRSALINHLPRHPATFPLRHHNASKNSPKRGTLSHAIQVSHERLQKWQYETYQLTVIEWLIFLLIQRFFN